MSEINYNDLFDNNINDSLKDLLKSLREINNELKELKQHKPVKIIKTNDGKEIITANNETEKLKQNISKLNAVEKEKIKLEQKIQDARTKEKKANEVLKQQLSLLNKENKQLARVKLGLVDSYEKETQRLKQLIRQYKNLAVQNKENTAEAKKLLQEITKLDSKIKRVDASVGQHQRNVGNYRSAWDGLKSSWIGITAAAGAIIGVLSRIGKKFVEFVDAYSQQQRAVTSLNTALGKNTYQLRRQASALQASTQFGDEQIIQGQAYAAMLGLTENQIKQLTPAVLDFAAAKGMDLKTAFDLVTKSVASETNALSRYGIVVEGVKGSTERLQSAITSLNKAYGGQAEAQARVDGGLKQLKNTIGDVKEITGGFAVILLNELIPGLRETMDMLISSGQLTLELYNNYGLSIFQAQKLANTILAINEYFDENGEKFRNAADANLQRLKALYVFLKKNPEILKSFEGQYDKFIKIFKEYTFTSNEVADVNIKVNDTIAATGETAGLTAEQLSRLSENLDKVMGSKGIQELFTNIEEASLQMRTERQATWIDNLLGNENDIDKALKIKQKQIETYFRNVQDIASTFGGQVGEIIGSAMAGNTEDFKEKLKETLITALSMLKNQAIGAITLQSIAQPDSVATFGLTGATRIAVLSGLIEAGFQVAKAGIQKFKEGGIIELKGDRHSVYNPGIWIGGNNFAEDGEIMQIISRANSQKYRDDIYKFNHAINTNSLDSYIIEKSQELQLDSTNIILKNISKKISNDEQLFFDNNGKIIAKKYKNVTYKYI